MSVVVLRPETVGVVVQSFEYFTDCDRVRRRLERMDVESKAYLLAIARNAPECCVKEMLASFEEVVREFDLDIAASNNGKLYRKLRELSERTGFFEYVKENGKTRLKMDERLAKYLRKRISRELRNRPGIVCRKCGKPIGGEYYIAVRRQGVFFYHTYCLR